MHQIHKYEFNLTTNESICCRIRVKFALPLCIPSILVERSLKKPVCFYLATAGLCVLHFTLTLTSRHRHFDTSTMRKRSLINSSVPSSIKKQTIFIYNVVLC